MRIQHNMPAFNAHRQLGANNNAVSKNLEKLSSGYRINRAGDDAAGLAISEKMRAQIQGLDTATSNANDGISLVQTAEGALTEVHSMLNRMVELATQSANGTYDNKTDRANLQKEVESLKSEIDRISDSTNYNGIKLLDGSIGGTSSAGGLTGAAIVGYKGAVSASTAPTVATDTAATFEVSLTGLTVNAAAGTDTLTLTVAGQAITSNATGATGAIVTDDIGALFDTKTVTIGAETYTGAYDAANDKLVFTASATGVKVPADIPAAGNGVFSSGTATVGGTATQALTIENGTVAGTTPALDFTKSDTINVDGTDIKVDWSKLTTEQQSVITKGQSTTNIDEAKAAAQLIQDTINSSIQDYNNTYSGNVQEIKVTADEANVGQYIFESTLKDATSKISFSNDTADANIGVLGTMFGSSTVGSTFSTAAPDGTLKGQAADYNGKFTMSLDGEEFEVDLSLVTSDTDVASRLQTALNATLTKYDSVKGLTGKSDALMGTDGASPKITVKLNDQGSLEFSNISGKKLSFADKNDGEVAKTLGISTEGKATGNGGLTLQVGDTSDDYQKVSVNVDNMSAQSLGIESISVANQTSASAAIDKIKSAINTVSSTRGDLGAVQNRLEHTINILGVASENMTAAESRIRDVDMAAEMMEFTKNNILTQASQAMLAQANQLPQGVLQLLQ